MYRKISIELDKWENGFKKPLMLVGARQTSKTYILKNFCKEIFENYLYFNLEKEQEK